MRLHVTGIGGLIGSAVAEAALCRGWQVSGVDSDARGRWFGPNGSTAWRLRELLSLGAEVANEDFRERPAYWVKDADLVVHCASQPSHDFSRENVHEDSAVNYMGTVELLETVRAHAPEASFVFLSTNKVYGDFPNMLAYERTGRRLVPDDVYANGFDEITPLEPVLHTPFGVSKLAADLMVQEYRKCFGLKTVSLRCGCLTGKTGSAVEAQGFLGYLVRSAVRGERYTIYGHEGYQVRDNIDADDVASAIFAVAEDDPGETIFNMGGGPQNSVSVLEAIDYLRTRHGCSFPVTHGAARLGDHRWWITDTSKFEKRYHAWKRQKTVWQTLDEMVMAERDKLLADRMNEPVSA